MEAQTTAEPTTNKTMNIVLWVAQVALAGMFAMAGFTKVSMSIPEVIEAVPALEGMAGGLIRFIGTAELLGAIGLIVPALTRIQPKLTAYAGIGLAIIMVLAAIVHGTRGEFPMIGMNVVLGAVALFIAWGRMKKAPIEGK